MKRRIWFCHILLMIPWFLVYTMGHVTVDEKAEATIPNTALSPPEGNTTFLDATTWCVAIPWAPQMNLQIALDWACGEGKADCSLIKAGGLCYEPNTVVSHASYAFNAYYQQNGNNDIACNFGGTSTLTKKDPSYGKCSYAASSLSPLRSSTTKQDAHNVLIGILMLLYMTIWYN
ncbi:major pollen allergen Ole e 10-like [Chenopodium quinoa]|nr:major pollen allergen Ole e 10-like [Chenopodium quinoa]